MVTATRDYHREERPPSQCHAVGFLVDGVVAEHFRVHFQGGDGSRSNDYRAEAVEDGLDGYCSVKASEMEYGIGDCGSLGFVGLKNQKEAFVVGCCKGGKCCYFLKWLVVFNVREFQRPDERS